MSKLNPGQVCAKTQFKKNQIDAVSISNKQNLKHNVESDFEYQGDILTELTQVWRVVDDWDCRG